MQKSEFDKEHIALHKFVWGHELGVRVMAQAWGRIGKKRLEWLKSEGVAGTQKFGIDNEFMRLFVDGDDPIYERCEEVSGDLEGCILRTI